MLGGHACKNMSNFFVESSFCQNNRKAFVEEECNPTHFPTLSKPLSAKHRFFLLGWALSHPVIYKPLSWILVPKKWSHHIPGSIVTSETSLLYVCISNQMNWKGGLNLQFSPKFFLVLDSQPD
jgi:hypothetical protein